MSLQFAQSLRIIQRSSHTNRLMALMRHLGWQRWKVLPPRQIRRQISRSTIVDDEPGGVISMVNMLGRYDFNNMHFVQAVLAGESAPVFVDVGANIGSYTLIASEIAGVSVLSLEPVPATYAKLQRNVALNRRANVRTLNIAASRQPGRMEMTCGRDSATNRILRVRPDGAAPDQATASVAVDTLDRICAELGVWPSVIKIDVEGHELDVLAGAVDCLAACRACLIENGDRPEIAAFMRKQGMLGPFYYHHQATALSREPQRLTEDHVYVSSDFAARYPGFAWDAAPEASLSRV